MKKGWEIEKNAKIADFVHFRHKYPVLIFFADMRFVVVNSKYSQNQMGGGGGGVNDSFKYEPKISSFFS